MDAIITRLIIRLDVNTVETHMNMCLMLRNHFGMSDVVAYVHQHLGHILHMDEMLVFTQSIMDMDRGVVSINL